MGTLLQRAASLLIYGGTLRLRPYEDECLRGWSQSLPPTARDIFARQRIQLDLYKRTATGRTLLLFPSGWPNGKPLPAQVRFPLDEDESRVARVRMDCPSEPTIRFGAVIVLSRGQLMSVEFSSLPPRGCWSNIRAGGVSILRDVMTPSKVSQDTEVGHVPPSLTWLMERYADARCGAPRSDEEISAFLSSFEGPVPRDYEVLLRATNGVSAGPVTIHGVGDVWTIPRPDGPFVAIANVRDVGDLAIKPTSGSSALYLLDAEGDAVVSLGAQFSAALERALDEARRRAQPGGN